MCSKAVLLMIIWKERDISCFPMETLMKVISTRTDMMAKGNIVLKTAQCSKAFTKLVFDTEKGYILIPIRTSGNPSGLWG